MGMIEMGRIMIIEEPIIAYKSFSFKTTRLFDFRDITGVIEEFIIETGIQNGQVLVQVPNTTASVLVNENESGLLEKDFLATLERLAPSTISYQHDNFEVRTQNMTPGECENGHSHCKAMLLPFSVPIILMDGKLRLGNWGRIIFVELDCARDDRWVEVSIIGGR